MAIILVGLEIGFVVAAQEAYSGFRRAVGPQALALPGNCLVCSLLAWVVDPRHTKVCRMRNRHGRWHLYWTRHGERFEFHAPGRSTKTYLQNALYLGRVRSF